MTPSGKRAKVEPSCQKTGALLSFCVLEALVIKITVFGRLELKWCERKTLLPGWWLEASAGVM